MLRSEKYQPSEAREGATSVADKKGEAKCYGQKSSSQVLQGKEQPSVSVKYGQVLQLGREQPSVVARKEAAKCKSARFTIKTVSGQVEQLGKECPSTEYMIGAAKYRI